MPRKIISRRPTAKFEKRVGESRGESEESRGESGESRGESGRVGGRLPHTQPQKGNQERRVGGESGRVGESRGESGESRGESGGRGGLRKTPVKLGFSENTQFCCPL